MNISDPQEAHGGDESAQIAAKYLCFMGKDAKQLHEVGSPIGTRRI